MPAHASLFLRIASIRKIQGNLVFWSLVTLSSLHATKFIVKIKIIRKVQDLGFGVLVGDELQDVGLVPVEAAVERLRKR